MLSENQINQFQQQGYLVVENAVNAHIIDDLKNEYDEILSDMYDDWHVQGKLPENSDGLSFWQKLDNVRDANLEWFQPFDISLPHADISEDTPFHFGEAVFNLLTCPRLLDIAESLLGGELTSNPIQHVRIKPPECEVDSNELRPHIKQTAWHQDRGVTLAEADKTDMITVWVAVTDATVENGCLQVLPKAADMLPHCPRTQTTLADGFIDETQAIPLEIKVGDAVILHPLTPHSSLVNVSNGYRWSFDLRYNVTGQPTGRSHFPDFIARSRKNPESELKDWQEWKKMWEDTRYHLANSPHIEQHRWQADGAFCA